MTTTSGPVAIFRQLEANGGTLPEVTETMRAAGHVLRTMLGRMAHGQHAADRALGYDYGTTHLLTAGQTTGEVGLDEWCSALGLVGGKKAHRFLTGDQWQSRVLEALVLLDMFADEDGFERSMRACNIDHRTLAGEMHAWRTLSTLSTTSISLLGHRYNYDHMRAENGDAWCDMHADYETLVGAEDEDWEGGWGEAEA